MDLPNLQQEIEKRASNKLDADISKMSEEWKEIEGFPLKNGVAIHVASEKDAEGRFTTSYPFLCQIFDCHAVKYAIREYYLPIYIKREIEAILKK